MNNMFNILNVFSVVVTLENSNYHVRGRISRRRLRRKHRMIHNRSIFLSLYKLKSFMVKFQPYKVEYYRNTANVFFKKRKYWYIRRFKSDIPKNKRDVIKYVKDIFLLKHIRPYHNFTRRQYNIYTKIIKKRAMFTSVTKFGCVYSLLCNEYLNRILTLNSNKNNLFIKYGITRHYIRYKPMLIMDFILNYNWKTFKTWHKKCIPVSMWDTRLALYSNFSKSSILKFKDFYKYVKKLRIQKIKKIEILNYVRKRSKVYSFNINGRRCFVAKRNLNILSKPFSLKIFKISYRNKFKLRRRVIRILKKTFTLNYLGRFKLKIVNGILKAIIIRFKSKNKSKLNNRYKNKKNYIKYKRNYLYNSCFKRVFSIKETIFDKNILNTFHKYTGKNFRTLRKFRKNIKKYAQKLHRYKYFYRRRVRFIRKRRLLRAFRLINSLEYRAILNGYVNSNNTMYNAIKYTRSLNTFLQNYRSVSKAIILLTIANVKLTKKMLFRLYSHSHFTIKKTLIKSEYDNTKFIQQISVNNKFILFCRKCLLLYNDVILYSNIFSGITNTVYNFISFIYKFKYFKKYNLQLIRKRSVKKLTFKFLNSILKPYSIKPYKAIDKKINWYIYKSNKREPLKCKITFRVKRRSLFISLFAKKKCVFTVSNGMFYADLYAYALPKNVKAEKLAYRRSLKRKERKQFNRKKQVHKWKCYKRAFDSKLYMARFANAIFTHMWDVFIDVYVKGACSRLDQLLKIALQDVEWNGIKRRGGSKRYRAWFTWKYKFELGYRVFRRIYFLNPSKYNKTMRRLKRRVQRKIIRRTKRTLEWKRDNFWRSRRIAIEVNTKRRLRAEIRKL